MKRLIALVGLLGLGCGVATAQAQTLKLAYRQGDTHAFAAHITMNETIDLGAVSEPLTVDMTATETEVVDSVDSTGVADVTLTMTDVVGKVTAAGVTSTTNPTVAPIHMQLAPDGRTLSVNGLNFAGGSPFGSVGSNGPQSAVLPDGAVKPGDSWSKTYDQANPLGTGTVPVTARSKYLRDEKLNGVQTAVVNTKSTAPLDMSIDLAKYGRLTGSQATSLTKLGIQGMTIKGSDAGDITTWIAPTAHTIQKTSMKILIDGSFSFVLAPGATYPGPTGPFTIKGDETIDLTAK